MAEGRSLKTVPNLNAHQLIGYWLLVTGDKELYTLLFDHLDGL